MRGVIIGVIFDNSMEEVHFQQAMARLGPSPAQSGSAFIHQMRDRGSWFGG